MLWVVHHHQPVALPTQALRTMKINQADKARCPRFGIHQLLRHFSSQAGFANSPLGLHNFEGQRMGLVCPFNQLLGFYIAPNERREAGAPLQQCGQAAAILGRSVPVYLRRVA